MPRCAPYVTWCKDRVMDDLKRGDLRSDLAASAAHAVVLSATADMGKASGMEAAATMLLAMADLYRVGPGELAAAALALQEGAAEIREKAHAAIRPCTQPNID